MGWLKGLGPSGAGTFPRRFFVSVGEIDVGTSLSIYIDESGDFGNYSAHSPFYLVTLLFFESGYDLSKDNDILDSNIKANGFEIHAIHTGPIIRNEDYYENYTKEKRRKLLRSLLLYFSHIPVQYTTLCIEKRECADSLQMTVKLSKLITSFINAHLEYFHGFDNVTVYYDRGQVELTKVITSTLTALLSHITLERPTPVYDKLPQLADMLCTLELTAVKLSKGIKTNTDLIFFNNERVFNKNYLKVIRQRKLT